ncbi:F-box protein [Vitis vinifera]|uniref:F-box protein n=1 Tax=Vitis vinifera TaxID=29760 RepID=A0A438ENT4_VITVI|nr:F-box protein [Vitis vinifera]
MRLNSLVSAIRGVQILTLSRWTFEHMQIKLVDYLKRAENRLFLLARSCSFQFNNLEELWWIINSMDKYDIIVLLSFLKMCPSLKKLFLSIDPTSNCGLCARERECLSEVPPHTRLNHLKFIKLEGVMKEEDKISLAEHLLEVATMEPLVIAKSHDNHLSKLVKVPMPRLPSKGNQKKLQCSMQEKKCCYKFVKVKEGYSGELCSRHAHMDL